MDLEETMAAEELADRLYAVPPERFVVARDEAVAAARAAGDQAAAREIARLRKPTIAAWLVNLLALRRPELVAELADLAGALRTAQRGLRGSELRELSAQRRAAVSALVAQARELALAEDPGTDPSRLPLAEVETTLTAALSDVDVAEQLRTGRLVRAVTYAGFGEVPRPQLRLVTGGAGATEAGDDPEQAPRAPDRAAVRREVAAARTAQKRAEADVQQAVAAEADGARALERLESELSEMERRRAAAEEELGRRKLARKSAERAAAAARQRFGEAQGALEAIDADQLSR